MSHSIFRSAGIVAGSTLISRLLGFVPDMVIAAVFGASTAYCRIPDPEPVQKDRRGRGAHHLVHSDLHRIPRGSRLGRGSQKTLPLEGLAWGVILGGALQLLLQILNMMKSGSRMKIDFDHHPGMRKIFSMLWPALPGIAVYQIDILVITVTIAFLINISLYR